jgi:hypothetical protein
MVLHLTELDAAKGQFGAGPEDVQLDQAVETRTSPGYGRLVVGLDGDA